MQNKITPKGVTPLCGWDWIRRHYHDLDGWVPRIEIKRSGEIYKFSVAPQDYHKHIVKDVMKGVSQ